MKQHRNLVHGALLAWALATLAACAGAQPDSGGASASPSPRPGWQTAPRHSAGLAPDPILHRQQAIVQVYAAPTYGWRGRLAVHPWIIYKRAGQGQYTRYDVVGWRAPQVVQRDYALPDGLWYGAQPQVLVEHRGPQVERMIDRIEQAIASYPWADQYRSYPGPNSNTFLAHVGREVPELRLDLPANAIGKDYRPLNELLGRSPTGSGVQASLLGLLGLSIGREEGIELNLLGLNFGLDLNRPALRLPFWGRIGLSDQVMHVNEAESSVMSHQLQQIRFDSPESIAGWSAIDDRVMGGQSSSRLRADPAGFAVFEGVVSTANGGGFASVRHSDLPLGCVDASAYRLTVLGDGKRYRLNLRTDPRFDGINYQADFQPPAGEWVEIDLPIAGFEPRFRGRQLQGVPALQAQQVRQVGWMVADRQAGPFSLQIRSLVCVGRDSEP